MSNINIIEENSIYSESSDTVNEIEKENINKENNKNQENINSSKKIENNVRPVLLQKKSFKKRLSNFEQLVPDPIKNLLNRNKSKELLEMVDDIRYFKSQMFRKSYDKKLIIKHERFTKKLINILEKLFIQLSLLTENDILQDRILDIYRWYKKCKDDYLSIAVIKEKTSLDSDQMELIEPPIIQKKKAEIYHEQMTHRENKYDTINQLKQYIVKKINKDNVDENYDSVGDYDNTNNINTFSNKNLKKSRSESSNNYADYKTTYYTSRNNFNYFGKTNFPSETFFNKNNNILLKKTEIFKEENHLNPNQEMKSSFSFYKLPKNYFFLKGEKDILIEKNRLINEKRYQEEVKKGLDDFGKNRAMYKENIIKKYEMKNIINYYDKIYNKDEKYIAKDSENIDKKKTVENYNEFKSTDNIHENQKNNILSYVSNNLVPIKIPPLNHNSGTIFKIQKKQLEKKSEEVIKDNNNNNELDKNSENKLNFLFDENMKHYNKHSQSVYIRGNNKQYKEKNQVIRLKRQNITKVITNKIKNINIKTNQIDTNFEKEEKIKIFFKLTHSKSQDCLINYFIKEQNNIPNEVYRSTMMHDTVIKLRKVNCELLKLKEIEEPKLYASNYFSPLSSYDRKYKNIVGFGKNDDRYNFDCLTERKTHGEVNKFVKFNFPKLKGNYLNIRENLNSFKIADIAFLKKSLQKNNKHSFDEDTLHEQLYRTSLFHAFKNPGNTLNFPNGFLPKSGSGLLFQPISIKTKQKKIKK